MMITLDRDKEPYIKVLSNDKIINLTGQSGSGKSTYAKNNYSSDEYVIIDTDEIFSEKRFKNSSGLNKELGLFFRKKYEVLPDLGNDFDSIYLDILDYCKDIDKTIVIDCAQFHCIKDISILKGVVIVIRTCIDTCYNRCIERFKSSYNYTESELDAYKEKKKKIYTWYHQTNEFIKKIDEFDR